VCVLLGILENNGRSLLCTAIFGVCFIRVLFTVNINLNMHGYIY